MRVLLGALVCGLLAGCSVTMEGATVGETPDGSASASASASAPSLPTPTGPPGTPPPADVTCTYTETPDRPAPAGREVDLPPEQGDVTATGVVLHAEIGALPIALAGEDAPCTVRNFVHLAEQGFFDGTACHRLTTNETLKILQCGDPTGTGTGGPGYTIPDELPTDLEPAPSGGGAVIYQRGIVAMANAGPNTGGSQFFIVYGDSQIPPSYAVFGTVDEEGLATLDLVAEEGVGAGGQSQEDGPPNIPVEIQQAIVTA